VTEGGDYTLTNNLAYPRALNHTKQSFARVIFVTFQILLHQSAQLP
jgi:hypothetical protein